MGRFFVALGFIFLFINIRELEAQQNGVWTPIGPANATVLALTEDPFNSQTMYVGVYFDGLFRTPNRGATWIPVPGPFSTDTVFGIACDPLHQGTIYVATFQDGLFKTTDGGLSWNSISRGLAELDVEALALDPQQPNVLIAGTGTLAFRSTDAGASWTPIDAAGGLSARSIWFDPAHAGTVYVGTYYNGLMVSSDDGATFLSANFNQGTILAIHNSPDGSLFAVSTSGIFQLPSGSSRWMNITGDLPWTGIGDVLPVPANPSLLVAGTSTGIFIINQAAQAASWSNLASFGTRLLFADVDGEIFAASAYAGLYATSDIQSPFLLRQQGIQNFFVEGLAAFNIGGATSVFAGTDRGVFVQASGASSWSTSPDLQRTIFSLRQDPNQSSTIYAGTDSGGVYQTVDGGSHWTSMSNGLVPRQVVSIAQFSDVVQVVLAGTTSGVYRSTDNGLTWSQTTPLSTVFSIGIDLTQQGTAYLGANAGQLLVTTDYGQTFNPVLKYGLPASNIVSVAVVPYDKIYVVLANGQIFAALPSATQWFQVNSTIASPGLCVAANPNQVNTVYLGTNGGGLYESTDFGQTFTSLSSGLSELFVYSLAIDVNNGNTIYAGTSTGVYKSSDAGMTWGSAGAGLPAAPVLGLVMDPTNSSNLYASVLNQGIYRSSDGGATWTAATAGIPTGGPIGIALNPLLPSTLYAGTELLGVYLSTDGGNTWTPSSNGMSLLIRGIQINPQNPQTIYAASLSDGFFRSSDGGNTWSNVGLRDRNIFGIAMNPANPQQVYAATALGVSMTTDGGNSWMTLGQQASYILSLAVDPSNRNIVYIGTLQGQVLKSQDGGQIWQNLATGLPLGDISHLSIDPTSGAIYAAIDSIGVFKSSDGGQTWSQTAPIPGLTTVPTTALVVDPNSGAVFAGGQSVGIFRSTDGGQSWQSAITGITTLNIQSLFVSAHQTSVVFAGTTDAGLFKSTDGGNTWQSTSQGLAAGAILALAEDPLRTGHYYVGTGAGLFQSADSGATWTSIDSGLPQSGISIVLSDRSNSSLLYAVAGTSGLYMSQDGGASWSALPTSFSGAQILALDEGPSGVLYAGSLGQGVIRSTDGGQTWNAAATPGTVATVTTTILVDPANPSIVYAGTGGTGVMKSVDGGMNWQSVVNGLTQLFVVALTMDPVDPNTIYAGMAQGGVFVTNDGGQQWTPLLTGLYQENVVSLAVDPLDDRTVYAGTEGGGVFRIILPRQSRVARSR